MEQAKHRIRAVAYLTAAVLLVASIVRADQTDTHKTAGGIEIYIGVMPAEVIRGRESDTEAHMHGGVPTRGNLYHLVAALFEQASGKRITAAQVSATVTEPGMAGQSKLLQPMSIAEAMTFGNYFVMSDQRNNRIRLEIHVPGRSPVTADFEYPAGGR